VRKSLSLVTLTGTAAVALAAGLPVTAHAQVTETLFCTPPAQSVGAGTGTGRASVDRHSQDNCVDYEPGAVQDNADIDQSDLNTVIFGPTSARNSVNLSQYSDANNLEFAGIRNSFTGTDSSANTAYFDTNADSVNSRDSNVNTYYLYDSNNSVNANDSNFNMVTFEPQATNNKLSLTGVIDNPVTIGGNGAATNNNVSLNNVFGGGGVTVTGSFDTLSATDVVEGAGIDVTGSLDNVTVTGDDNAVTVEADDDYLIFNSACTGDQDITQSGLGTRRHPDVVC
jgi:hypothetical protein